MTLIFIIVFIEIIILVIRWQWQLRLIISYIVAIFWPILATEIICVGNGSKRHYEIKNHCVHLFVDRPVRHYCAYVWSYSGPRNYPLLPAFATFRKTIGFATTYKVFLFVAGSLQSQMRTLYMVGLRQRRLPHFIVMTKSRLNKPLIAVFPANIKSIANNMTYGEISLLALLAGIQTVQYYHADQNIREDLFQRIVTSGLIHGRVKAIIRYSRGHRTIENMEL